MTECILLHGNTPAQLDYLHEIDADTVNKIFGLENNKIRLGRIGTIGDGSCFFHSCCLAMNLHNYANLTSPGRKEIAYKLRIDMSEALTEKEFEKLGKGVQYDAFKEEIRQPKTWADEKMIKWASTFLNANIVFINVSNNKNQLFCGVVNESFLEAVKKCATRNSEIPTILIGWIDHSHFECIVRIDSVSENSVNTTSMFVPSNRKDLETTIVPMMLSYIKKCNA
jgi:hypothetical protein